MGNKHEAKRQVRKRGGKDKLVARYGRKVRKKRRMMRLRGERTD